jgi:hypothetical protein
LISEVAGWWRETARHLGVLVTERSKREKREI